MLKKINYIYICYYTIYDVYYTYYICCICVCHLISCHCVFYLLANCARASAWAGLISQVCSGVCVEWTLQQRHKLCRFVCRQRNSCHNNNKEQWKKWGQGKGAGTVLALVWHLLKLIMRCNWQQKRVATLFSLSLEYLMSVNLKRRFCGTSWWVYVGFNAIKWVCLLMISVSSCTLVSIKGYTVSISQYTVSTDLPMAWPLLPRVAAKDVVVVL